MSALKVLLKFVVAMAILAALAQVAKLLAGRDDDSSSVSYDEWPDVPTNPAAS
ncbi:MAG TPA: hypothetical protein VGS61_04415 [Acidimicrobiales bacterium]|nr:hypothetical protein [Acidimicrobiales bacterium]